MLGEIAPMHDSKMRDASQLFRRKQFEASEKKRRVVLFSNMVSDFDKMIVDLDRQIAAEEERTKIKDTGHPAYSTFATAAAKRRQNLLSSVAHMKSMLDVARRELHELTVQLRDLEPIQNNQPAPASSTPGVISGLR
jgi:flagellar protein FliJ